jgi:hypothetical protein
MNAASLIIFLAGMAAGWLLNDVLDRLARTREDLMAPQDSPPARRRAGSSWRARAAALRRNHAAMVGLAAVAVALAALIVGAINSQSAHEQNNDLAAAAQHNAEVSRCQSAFNTNVTRALAARARLNDQRTRVLIGFMSDLFAQPIPTSLPAALAQQRRDRQRFAEFRAEVAKLSEDLAAKQVPVLAAQCGTPTAVPSPART